MSRWKVWKSFFMPSLANLKLLLIWTNENKKNHLPLKWRKHCSRKRRVGNLMCKSQPHPGPSLAAATAMAITWLQLYRPLLVLQSSPPTISVPTFSLPTLHLPTLVSPAAATYIFIELWFQPSCGAISFRFFPRLNSLLLQVYLFLLHLSFGPSVLDILWPIFGLSSRVPYFFLSAFIVLRIEFVESTYISPPTFFQSYLTCPQACPLSSSS